ncbi:hypothetical protein [Nocardia sp. CC227C]|uniref:hypothetical protein n=1 Tax=Nocardia sp. CC227C TaxID=3044562 RepID=UPI00278C153B|nr:hypothetical protein [Nocardia sp. CC227C]
MRISLRGTADGLRVRMRLDVNRRRWLALRIMLGILAFIGLLTGLWAVLAPRSWYDSFPGFGMRWVSVDGPYNHHLAADVGAFFLALAVVALAALYLMDSMVARVAGVAWAVFGLPHLLYHVTHWPDELSGVSAVLSAVSLVLIPALGVACVFVAPRERHPVPEPAPFTLRFPQRRTGRHTRGQGTRPPR